MLSQMSLSVSQTQSAPDSPRSSLGSGDAFCWASVRVSTAIKPTQDLL